MNKRGTIQKSILIFIIILFVGTIFYHSVENWNWVDSFYFSGITLTTVGYGDLTPTQPISKIFTIFYIIGGLGVFLDLISKIFKRRIKKIEKTNQEIR